MLSSDDDAPIPWEGVSVLARYWAGAGSLVEWLAPPEWDLINEWSADRTRARLAQVLLLHLQRTVLPFLPRYSNQWLDLLEQQLLRASEFDNVPSAHTDWVATLSEYGRYPSEQYIDRRPYSTFDTPLARTLKWFCVTLQEAEALVARVLGHPVLTADARTQLGGALDLSEVRGAADSAELDEFDAAACVESGGIWRLIGTGARLMNTLWHGHARDQLNAFSPILPDLKYQLFELGVLSSAASAARRYLTASWSTRTPLAAALPGLPCIEGEASSVSWRCYYQTIPATYRMRTSPYRALAQTLGGHPLRPDFWIVSQIDGQTVEILVECKYSRHRGYIAEGIPQVMAYWLEFPPQPAVQRVHMVVGPETIIGKASSWKGYLAIGEPAHLCTLVQAACAGQGQDLLKSWG